MADDFRCAPPFCEFCDTVDYVDNVKSYEGWEECCLCVGSARMEAGVLTPLSGRRSRSEESTGVSA